MKESNQCINSCQNKEISFQKCHLLYKILICYKYYQLPMRLIVKVCTCQFNITHCFCRLTELKAESRGRREQREIDAMMLVAETKRRREIVEKQFYEWNDGKKVDSALIYTALQTYADTCNSALLFNRPLDAADKDRGGLYVIDYVAVYFPFTSLFYASAPQSANAYMFYICFFVFFCFFPSVKKYKTTVLRNGWTDLHETFTKR